MGDTVPKHFLRSWLVLCQGSCVHLQECGEEQDSQLSVLMGQKSQSGYIAGIPRSISTSSVSQVGIGGLAGKPHTWQVIYHGGSMLQFLRNFWLLTLSKRYLPILKAPPLVNGPVHVCPFGGAVCLALALQRADSCQKAHQGPRPPVGIQGSRGAGP